MTYQRISAILALIIVTGFVGLVAWAVYLLKDNQEVVIALVSGGMGSLATLAVKEFFGAPGPNNGNGHMVDGQNEEPANQGEGNA